MENTSHLVLSTELYYGILQTKQRIVISLDKYEVASQIAYDSTSQFLIVVVANSLRVYNATHSAQIPLAVATLAEGERVEQLVVTGEKSFISYSNQGNLVYWTF